MGFTEYWKKTSVNVVGLDMKVFAEVPGAPQAFPGIQLLSLCRDFGCKATQISVFLPRLSSESRHGLPHTAQSSPAQPYNLWYLAPCLGG